MNKISLWGTLYPQKLRTNRIFSIMKTTLFLAFVSAFSLYAGNTHSQNAKVTLSKSNSTLEVILNEIENQTDYLFIINSHVDTHQKSSVKVKETPVSEVLDDLFKDTDVHYMMEGTHIILSNKGVAKTPVAQQTRTVTGKIIDETGEPLIGVSVLVRGTNNGAITDVNGDYFITGNITDTTVLEITYIGMKKQTIEIGSRNRINVTMLSDAETLDEVVVVGYGTQKKVNLSGAVEAVSGKVLANRATNSIGTMLQGIVPNLNISIGDGQANSIPKFNVRGETSINGGTPLIVVDGIPTDASIFSRMNSSDIENISVLKDASSAAIYGAKAAYGVILVTTKRGTKSEKIRVDFNNSISLRKLGRMPKIVKDPYIQASYKKEMGKPWYDLYSDEDLKYIEEMKNDPSKPNVIPSFSNPEYYTYLGNTDWFSEIYDETGITHSHNLSLSGATDRTSYYVGMQYMQERGLLKINKDIMDRYNLRTKVDFKLTDWLTFGNNTSALYYTYKRPSTFSSWLFQRINNTNTLMTVKNPDGSWTKEGAELIGSLSEGQATTTELNLQSQFTLDMSLIKNVLSIKADATARLGNKETDQWDTDMNIPYKQGPNLAEESLGWVDIAKLEKEREQYISLNAYLDFNKSFGKHSLSALIGFNQEYDSHKYMRGEREELISSTLPSVELATGAARVREENYEWATRSGFFRLNYMFNNRYILETNGRYDGSSRFPKNDRFGFFPSVSAAWIITQEKFMKTTQSWLSHAKLRVSYGTLGNQDVGYYEYISSMDSKEQQLLLNGVKPMGVDPSGLVSSVLTWEKVYTQNLGLDLNFLANRLTFSGDIYRRDTKDMLTKGKTLPNVLGTSEPKINAANMKTEGWEVSLGWRDIFTLKGKPFNYSARFILSDSRSFITKFDNPTGNLNDYYAGQEIGNIWGLVTEGFFIDQADIDSHADQWDVTAYPGDRPIQPGDLKYKDLNGDKKINSGSWTIDDPGDYKVIGNTANRYNYGADFSADWNGFDLRILLQGVGKKDWYPESNYFFGIYRAPWANVLENNLDHWTPENTNAYFPRLKSYIAEGGKDIAINQTRYLQNASYLRIKNITIGYTLPKELTTKARLERVRFYLTGDNIFEFTKLSKNYDPEILGTSHPMQRIFSFGLNLSF